MSESEIYKPPFTDAIKHWCEINSWTEPEYREGMWYAYPPNSLTQQRVPYFVDLCVKFLGRDNNL